MGIGIASLQREQIGVHKISTAIYRCDVTAHAQHPLIKSFQFELSSRRVRLYFAIRC
jgi:hypothetical protein